MNKSDSGLLSKLLGSDEECCEEMSILPKHMPVAMAYVPYQLWEEPYETEVGLKRGTIFPALDKPFLGEEAVKNGDKD